LDVDSPGEQSYLRFGVSGVGGPVQSAVIWLFVGNGSTNGPSLYLTDGSWVESAITWGNRPAPTSGVIADIGVATKNTWAEYDVTGQVVGDGVYDFVLLPDSSNGVRFNSRETSSGQPELVLVFGGGDNLAPVAGDDSVSTGQEVAVSIDVAANDVDPDGVLDLGSANTACGVCSTPANGALVDGGDGTFEYTPAINFAGSDGFVYEICDTLGACDTATVTITVTSGLSSATFSAVADARVLESSPSTNYGSPTRQSDRPHARRSILPLVGLGGP